MKKIYKILGMLIIIAIVTAGCSSSEPDSNEVESDQASQPEEDAPREDEVEEEEKDQAEDEEVEEEKEESSRQEVKSKILMDMMDLERYTVEMKHITIMGEQKTESIVETVVADGQIYSHSETGGFVINYMEKGDKLYLIDHDAKTIIVSDRYEEDEEADLEVGDIFFDDLKYIGEGTDVFLENTRSYEEYEMELGRVKYFFEGNELDGMEMVMDMQKLLEDDGDDENFEMEDVIMLLDITSFEKEADMSVFELPEDYQILGQ